MAERRRARLGELSLEPCGTNEMSGLRGLTWRCSGIADLHRLPVAAAWWNTARPHDGSRGSDMRGWCHECLVTAAGPGDWVEFSGQRWGAVREPGCYPACSCGGRGEWALVEPGASNMRCGDCLVAMLGQSDRPRPDETTPEQVRAAVRAAARAIARLPR